MENGTMHGRGKLVFPDGIVYEGDFEHNQMNGTGVYSWPSGAVYEGSVLHGRREGFGRLSFTNSEAVYEGEWNNGVRHGVGTLYTNASRSSYYRGQWLNDQKHGVGMMRYENGDEYDGAWAHDLKCGQGVMRWAGAGSGLQQQFRGEWQANQPNGVGLHIWFTEPADQAIPTHAQLLMYNRYYGHFKDGKRHGYGVLYYATGARYEGYWHADLKHGSGCHVFENGEAWRGSFEGDRPLLGPDDTFAPLSTGIALQIGDLVEEEENPGACRRAIANLLMCYNTELRMLYDKYCKRPSHHLPLKGARLSFSMVSAQFWEMVGDCRLLGSHLTLAQVDALLARARLLPEGVRSFRSCQTPPPAALAAMSRPQQRFWRFLGSEHVGDGEHSPTAELTFPAFCEAVVRVAAVRYHALPTLERRLHAGLTLNLLHLVNKAKATPPSPPPPPPVLPPETSIEAAMGAAERLKPALADAFAAAASAAGADALACADAMPETPKIYALAVPARLLADYLAGACSGLGRTLTRSHGLLQLLWPYLARNTHAAAPRGAAAEAEPEPAAPPSLDVLPADEAELTFMAEQPVTFADLVDAVLRLACSYTALHGAGEGLEARVREMMGLAGAAAEDSDAAHDAGGEPEGEAPEPTGASIIHGIIPKPVKQ